MEESAVAVTVDIVGQFIDDLKVDKRGYIEVFGIARMGRVEIAAIEGVFSGFYEALEVSFLGLGDLSGLGVIPGPGVSPAVGKGDVGIADEKLGIEEVLGFVDLDDVTSGDVVTHEFVGVEFGDIDAVGVAFDFFGKLVNPFIIPVDIEFAEAEAGLVASHMASQMKGECIPEEGFIAVGGVEDPVGFRRHTQQGGCDLIAEGVAEFESITFLRKHL